jgi:hypothetical protein
MKCECSQKYETGNGLSSMTERHRHEAQAAQKDSEPRRANSRRAQAYYPVRWSESIERNEGYESFSAAC